MTRFEESGMVLFFGRGVIFLKKNNTTASCGVIFISGKFILFQGFSRGVIIAIVE